QRRAEAGNAPLGFANPYLYAIGKGVNYHRDFHDIANGATNLYYPAVAGYDDATGWGSPVGAPPLADLACCDRTPLAPTSLTAKPGPGKVSLAWVTANGATGFHIRRSATAGGSYALVSTLTNAASYVDTHVVSGTTYYYMVTAFNGSGESDTV